MLFPGFILEAFVKYYEIVVKLHRQWELCMCSTAVRDNSGQKNPDKNMLSFILRILAPKWSKYSLIFKTKWIEFTPESKILRSLGMTDLRSD